MSEKNRWKTLGSSLITLVLITGLVMLVMRDQIPQLKKSLLGLTPGGIVLLVLAGIWVPFMDAVILRYLARRSNSDFRVKCALETVFLGVFGNVSTLAAGTLPMQGLYLSRHGFEAGESVGMLTIQYVLHKTAVLLFAILMMLIQPQWIRAVPAAQKRLIVTGLCICLLLIGGLILLCVWKTARLLAQRALCALPEKGGWKERGQRWSLQLDELNRASREILHNRSCRIHVLMLNFVKLAGMCAIPAICVCLAGAVPLPIMRVEMLTAIMLLITGALPNVAGVGPTEFGFLLLFSELLGTGQAAAVLVLYRISTYYIPFALSIPIFLRIQRRYISGK